MDFLTIYKEGYLHVENAETYKEYKESDYELWRKIVFVPELRDPHASLDIIYVIEFQDGRKERCHVRRGTMQQPRSIPVGKCLEQGFTAPQNEIVKFITGRIDQLVMFRKYNKKKRANPKNPDAGK